MRTSGQFVDLVESERGDQTINILRYSLSSIRLQLIRDCLDHWKSPTLCHSTFHFSVSWEVSRARSHTAKQHAFIVLPFARTGTVPLRKSVANLIPLGIQAAMSQANAKL
jgi:hypothetical protein